MNQSQDSLTSQLRALIQVANFHGYYDAADFLTKQVAVVDARLAQIDQEERGVIVERPPMGGRRVDFVPETGTAWAFRDEPQPPLYIKDPGGAKVMVPNPDYPSRTTGPLYPHCHD